MGRIDGHGGEQQIKLTLAVFLYKGSRAEVQFVQAKHANSTVMHWRAQLLIPAAVLIVNKLVGVARDQVALFDEGECIVTGLGIDIFEFLVKAVYLTINIYYYVNSG